jgi:hypothetical protein
LSAIVARIMSRVAAGVSRIAFVSNIGH